MAINPVSYSDFQSKIYNLYYLDRNRITDEAVKSSVDYLNNHISEVLNWQKTDGLTRDLGNLQFGIRFCKQSLSSQKTQVIFTKTLGESGRKDLLKSLEFLENQVKHLNEKIIIFDYFKMNSPIPDKIAHVCENFINFLFGPVLKKTSNRIFHGHKNAVELEKTNTEIRSIQRQINQLKAKELPNAVSPKLQELMDKKSALELKRNGITGQGREVNKEFCQLGGKIVKMQLPDENVQLAGLYISNADFRNSLKKAGVEMATVGSYDTVACQCIAIPSASATARSALEELGLNRGAGFIEWEYGDKTLFIPEENMAQMDPAELEIQFSNFDPMPDTKAGTVLMTSGNAGIYSMHKKEVLAFLMRGMNVMAFDFRGYGESTGNPTANGLKRDMECAYQYLKQHYEVPDNKILLKALCMSGGPATHLAANHPEVNLLIDQTYADFSNLVKDNVNEFVEQYLKTAPPSTLNAFLAWFSKHANFLIAAFAKLISPGWSVRSEIGKVKGHVAILAAREDTLMEDKRDFRANVDAATRSGVAASISSFTMKGEHSTSWVSSVMLPNDWVTILPDDQVERIATEVAAKYSATINAESLVQFHNKVLKDQKDFLSPFLISNSIREVMVPFSGDRTTISGIEEFFNRVIQAPQDYFTNKQYQNSIFEGRAHLDAFLQKAELSGSFFKSANAGD